MSKMRRIPPGELSAYERWELPNIGVGESDAKRAKPKKVEEKIKPLTAADIEKIRQQAYDAGFEEGREAGVVKGLEEGRPEGVALGQTEGLQQGLLNGEAQIEEKMQQLTALLTQLADPLTQQQTILEQAIINVAMAVSRAVIFRELSIDSSSIQFALTHLLSSLPKMDVGCTLRVNSRDETIIRDLLEGIDSKFELTIDDSLTVGGCKLETSSQLIDYTIEKRFQKVVYSTLFEASKAETQTSDIEASASIQTMSDFPTDTLNEAEDKISSPDANTSSLETSSDTSSQENEKDSS